MAHVKKWKPRVLKLLKILRDIQGPPTSSLTSIGLSDLELILNGLGFAPTLDQLEEMAFEVRFGDSHATWEVHQSIEVEDFCCLINHYGQWLHNTDYRDEIPAGHSVQDFIAKSVETLKCFDVHFAKED